MKKNLMIGVAVVATLVITNVRSYKQGLRDGIQLDKIARARAFKQALRKAGLGDIIKED